MLLLQLQLRLELGLHERMHDRLRLRHVLQSHLLPSSEGFLDAMLRPLEGVLLLQGSLFELLLIRQQICGGLMLHLGALHLEEHGVGGVSEWHPDRVLLPGPMSCLILWQRELHPLLWLLQQLRRLLQLLWLLLLLQLLHLLLQLLQLLLQGRLLATAGWGCVQGFGWACDLGYGVELRRGGVGQRSKFLLQELQLGPLLRLLDPLLLCLLCRCLLRRCLLRRCLLRCCLIRRCLIRRCLNRRRLLAFQLSFKALYLL